MVGLVVVPILMVGAEVVFAICVISGFQSFQECGAGVEGSDEGAALAGLVGWISTMNLSPLVDVVLKTDAEDTVTVAVLHCCRMECSTLTVASG